MLGNYTVSTRKSNSRKYILKNFVRPLAHECYLCVSMIRIEGGQKRPSGCLVEFEPPKENQQFAYAKSKAQISLEVTSQCSMSSVDSRCFELNTEM